MSSYLSFINSFITKQGQSSTNVSLPPSPGKWSIPDEEYETFLLEYSKEICEGQTEMYMTELHKSYGPLVIDLDFKHNLDSTNERKYNAQDILSIVELYNDQIFHHFNVELDKIQAYVLEKEQPTKLENCIKDGFHIIYPEIIAKIDVQYAIRANVVEMCKSSSILFTHLNLVEKNSSIEEIIDESVIKKSGWMMYGSKKQNTHSYELTKIIDTNLEEISFDFTFDKIVSKLSIRNKKESDILVPKIEIKKPVVTGPIPSVHLNNRTDLIDNEEDTNLFYIKLLVELLSTERSDKRETWIEVGSCLYNINSNDLLDVWDNFSKLSSKYRAGECERKWNSFESYEGRRLSIGSLHLWAKNDNEEGYRKLKRDYVQNYLINNLDCTHNDVACLLHCKFEFDYVCSNIKHKTWYKYESHTWKEMDNAVDLREMMSNDIVNEYKKVGQYFKRQSLQDPEDQEIRNKIQIVDKIIKSLKDRKFKDNVIKECEDKFNDIAFDKLSDNKVNLIGFTNGVYDLEKLEFRSGRPDDYITFSTNFEYVPYTPHSSDAKEMNEFLKKVLPLCEVRKYVIKLISSFLCGEQGEQKFIIWTGTGANGKSKLIDLIEMAFGDYSQKLPVTVLTRPRGSSGSATPEMANTKGKRFVSFQEPEKDDKIHVGHMKELSGGDKISTRALYKNSTEFVPQFKMILSCNDLPNIPSNDGGTWRRLRVVEFPSKFVDEPSAPNEFQKDIRIPSKLRIWKSHFMSLLINTYEKYLKEGLKEPECVLKFTKEYQRKSDIYLDFIEENIKVTEDEKDTLKLNEIYNQFKAWHIDAYSEKPKSNRNELKDYFDHKFGILNKRFGWKGIQFLDETLNEDETNNDL